MVFLYYQKIKAGEKIRNNKKIIQLIFKAVDELNPNLPKDQRLTKSRDTVLFGKSGKLDSLGLVNLIVAVEQKIEEEFEVSVNLANEKAISQKNSPFKTIATLASYTCKLVEENKNE